jgi:hypothetical protein
MFKVIIGFTELELNRKLTEAVAEGYSTIVDTKATAQGVATGAAYTVRSDVQYMLVLKKP